MSASLREFRKSKGWTLDDLAEKVELSAGQLSRIEREGTTSLPTAMKLAKLTELPVETFVRVAA